jgi:hypothetical protein
MAFALSGPTAISIKQGKSASAVYRATRTSKPSGSPARDAGVTLSEVPLDKDGLTRPQGAAYCIGAFEFV